MGSGNGQSINSRFTLAPTFYPASNSTNPKLQNVIASHLKHNAQDRSYGIILDVGLSSRTLVTCCVYGCTDYDGFQAPEQFSQESSTVPVLIVKDSVLDASCMWCRKFSVERQKWSTSAVHGYESSMRSFETTVDLSGYSIGLEDQHEVGTFGFYGYNQHGETRGFTAHHAVSSAQRGASLVSPSTLELSLRLEMLRNGKKLGQKSQLEKNVLHTTFANYLPDPTSTYVCGGNHTGAMVVYGKNFGRVIDYTEAFKKDVIFTHNERLHEEGLKEFDYPSRHDKQKIY